MVPIVAHSGVIAITLSHNFRAVAISCTNGGETRPESDDGHCGDRNLSSKLVSFAARGRSVERLLFPSYPILEDRGAGAAALPAGFLGQPAIHLGLAVTAQIFLEETGAHFHAQAHISTKSTQAREDSRFPRTDEDQGGRSGAEQAPRHRPQTRGSQRRLPRLSGWISYSAKWLKGSKGISKETSLGG